MIDQYNVNQFKFDGTGNANHGIVYAKHAKDLATDPNNDFADEVHSYMPTLSKTSTGLAMIRTGCRSTDGRHGVHGKV